MRLQACLHLAQPRNMTKEGGDRVSPLKRYFVVPLLLPAYDVAQLQAGEAVGPEGVDANKFDFLAKGVIPCVFFFCSFLGEIERKKVGNEFSE